MWCTIERARIRIYMYTVICACRLPTWLQYEHIYDWRASTGNSSEYRNNNSSWLQVTHTLIEITWSYMHIVDVLFMYSILTVVTLILCFCVKLRVQWLSQETMLQKVMISWNYFHSDLPSKTSESVKRRNFRKQAVDFVVKDDQLYHKDKKIAICFKEK